MPVSGPDGSSMTLDSETLSSAFIVDGFTVRAIGSFKPQLPSKLIVVGPTMTYNELNDFVGTYTVTGTVGPATINLMLSGAAQLTINGGIVPPLPDPKPKPLVGDATWNISYQMSEWRVVCSCTLVWNNLIIWLKHGPGALTKKS